MGVAVGQGLKTIGAAIWIVIAAFLLIGALVTGVYVAAILFALSGVAALPQAREAFGRYGITGGRRTLLSAATGIAGFVVIGANAPATPDARSPQPNSTVRTDASVDDIKAANDQAATQRARDASTRTAAKQAFLDQYRRVLVLAKPCDQSIGVVGEAADSGSLVNLYSAAKDGQGVCQTAWLDIQKLEPGDVPDEVEEKQKKAIETCGNAYFLRQRAMETAMKIADGDTKASNVVSFQDDVRLGQTGVIMCVAQWMEAGGALGIKPGEMR